ncbi:AAA domain-containing protein [Nocardia cyriacigeorgica]|uniref:AAA domain-containing protein n=1 Tax=Nocardia cyriacigeorgica TaxID=135487 RepID=UPI002454B651|nr:AAA domain-containing protein [Nocardia cyriacigeorgica]
MFGDRVVSTAADLTRAARCEFAMLHALDTEMGAVPAGGGEVAPGRGGRADLDAERAGMAAKLRERHGAGFVEISAFRDRIDLEDGGDDIIARLRAAHSETLAALHSRAPVIAGAVFFDGEFACRAEFLVRAEHRVRYRVHGLADADFSITGALELAGCAAAIEAAGVPADPLIAQSHGDRIRTLPLAELLPVYRARRARVRRIVEEKLGELLPAQWGDPRYLACGHCPVCVEALTAARDLLLVAGMSGTARARLRESGIGTIDRLAAAPGPLPTVPEVAPRTLLRLRRQAEIQLRRDDSGRPAHTLIDPAAIGALPPTSPGDLGLTIDVVEPGWVRIELGGSGAVQLSAVVPLSAARDGRPDGVRTRGRDALDAVLRFICERRSNDPELHIFHYTSAVRSALVCAGARFGTGEDLIDELLTGGVLVDLYPIVRNAVLIGTDSYRLTRLRSLLPGAPPAPGADHDCVTVLGLRDWLLDRAAEQGIEPRTHSRRTARRMQPGAAPTVRPLPLEAALAEFAHADAPTIEPSDQDAPAHPADAPDHRSEVDTPARRVAAVMAAALGYRRRERQPLWWAHADRLSHPVDEWPEAPGVLVADWGTVDTKWHIGPRGDTMRRFLTLTGRMGAGSGLAPGTAVHTFYDRPVGAAMAATAGTRATATATVLGCSVDAEFDDTVRLEERLPPGCAPFDDLPTAIAPGPPGHDDSVDAAMEHSAQLLLMTLPHIPANAVFDILARRVPRLRPAGGPLPRVHGDHAAAITAAVRSLDDSYVAVHGPPGTGKTATVARVVERMVTRYGWRVGVVAPTPAIVENVLDAVVEAGVLPELVAKKDVTIPAPEWAVIDAERYPRFLDNAINGCVVGGAPADFADPALIPYQGLDLLVIADAGRFALAEAVAAAVSAHNLLLIGDPVPAPAATAPFAPHEHIAAAHPEPVGESVLGWLTEGGDTLPADRGYFLDRTWRMPAQVAEPMSRLYYDGRLRACDTVTLARRLTDIAPGVDTVLVDHHGDSTESVAEAREVVRRVRALLGLSWTIGATTRRLHPHDIFVVTPYRAQVARISTLLARAKIDDVLVGTPELFRGREAAVVIVSMTTSSPADAPHGVPGLISRTIVQGAVCRALWKAIIIRSPLLTEYLPASAAELTELSRLLRLG